MPKKHGTKRYEELNNLTLPEKKFADLVVSGATQEEAARQAYNVTTKASAANIGNDVANRDRVRAYIVEQSLKAAERIAELGEKAKNESVRLAANQDILNRADIGVQKQVNAVQINIGGDQEEYA